MSVQFRLSPVSELVFWLIEYFCIFVYTLPAVQQSSHPAARLARTLTVALASNVAGFHIGWYLVSALIEGRVW